MPLSSLLNCKRFYFYCSPLLVTFLSQYNFHIPCEMKEKQHSYHAFDMFGFLYARYSTAWIAVNRCDSICIILYKCMNMCTDCRHSQ